MALCSFCGARISGAGQYTPVGGTVAPQAARKRTARSRRRCSAAVCDGRNGQNFAVASTRRSLRTCGTGASVCHYRAIPISPLPVCAHLVIQNSSIVACRSICICARNCSFVAADAKKMT